MEKLTIDDYLKAQTVFEDKKFENQDLLLHDYADEVYKTKQGYTDNGIHWGYVDSLVSMINGKPGNYGFRYALILDGEFNPNGVSKQHLENSRFSKVKFSEIKDIVMKNMVKKIADAKKENESFLKKKKKPVVKEYPLDLNSDEYFVVRYNDNWADEMDVSGFVVLSKDELDSWKKRIPAKDFTFCIGTNEEIEYSSSKDLLKNCKIEKITLDEAKTLYKLFKSKDVKCSDWNGRYFNLIERRFECVFGFFPKFDNND